MDNQHKQIKGYRDLSQAEIDLMNEIKAKGEELRALVAKISSVVIPPLPVIKADAADSDAEMVAGETRSIETEADDPLTGCGTPMGHSASGSCMRCARWRSRHRTEIGLEAA